MNDSLKAQCTAEFLGTGLFLFFGIGCLSALKVAGASLGLWEICIIWGLGISLAVYLTSGISGGHLNPAVTVALWLFACFPGRKVFPILSPRSRAPSAARCWPMCCTARCLPSLNPPTISLAAARNLQLASIFSTYPAASLSIWHAALVEVVITSMLMGMIMALTDDGNGVPKGPLAPLLIGLLVAVIGASTGPLTGFAMNPARDFGPKLFTWMAGWGDIAMTGGRDIPYFIVPIIAPLIGACLGAAIYRYLIGNNLPCNTCKLED